MEYSITEAAEICNVSRQAIAVAISKKKLVATKAGYRWKISADHLVQYRKNRYNRMLSVHEGKPLFGQNEFSVTTAAEQLGVPPNRIYYCIKKGILPSERRRCSYVIKLDHLNQLKERIRNKKKFKKVA